MFGYILLIIVSLYYGPWLTRWIRKFVYQYPCFKKLPGPKGIPFIGSAFDITGDATVPLKFWIKEADKARAQGDNIFTMTVMGRNFTFPVTAETVKAICESNEEVLKGRDYEFLRPWVGSGIILSIGKRWKDGRRALLPAFHLSMTDGYLKTFNKHARVLVDLLGEKSGQIVDMGDHIKRYGLDSIFDAAMGVEYGIQNTPSHPYLKAVEVFTKFSQRYSTEPHMWVNWIWFLCYQREYKDALDKLNAVSEEIMTKRLEKVNSGEVDLNAKNRPLIDTFFTQYLLGELTLEEVHHELNSAIFGGHETTAATLTWVYWALAALPHLQQRVYEEISEIFGDSDRDCTHEDVKEMEFTERFIKESMRIFPPIPAISRELMSDFQMGKYLLPKGSEIFISPHIIHHNPEVYPDPWTFDPDRFLPEKVAERSPYDFVPFSAGPRNCMAQKFAMQEMKTVVSHTLRNFSFHTHHDLLDQECALEVMCTPTLGCHLRVEKRK